MRVGTMCGRTGAFGSKQPVGVLTAVTALQFYLPYPQAAIQTRLSATSAPLHSVMPSATPPEPHQTALATELVAICSAWSALDTQGPLAAKQHVGVLTAVTALHCSHGCAPQANDAMHVLCTAYVLAIRNHP